MRQVLPVILLVLLGACVPTTKYTYVPLTQQNFEAAAPIRDAEWTDNGICGQAHPPIGDDDGNRCYDWDQIAGIGIPYEGRSLSVIPMAAVQIGKCDLEALAE